MVAVLERAPDAQGLDVSQSLVVSQSPPSVLDAVVSPDDTAAFLASARPAGSALACLDELPPSALSAAGRIDTLVAIGRAQAWLNALQQRLLAAMVDDVEASETSEPLRDASGHCWLAEEVACALHLAPVTAEDRLLRATDLVRRLPATLALLEAGDISLMHAVTLSAETGSLTDAQVEAVQGRVLPRAPGQTVGEFKRAVRRAVKSVDGRKDKQRHRDAVADRRVVMTPRDDGTAEIWALLPADGAAIVMAGLNRYAAVCGPSDTRTADQRRADALVELGLAALADTSVPGEVKPAVNITVGLATLLGDNDQPAELDGYGPIPASMARRIAADPSGTWRRLITDEAGRLLDYGTRTYRPPAELARHVQHRDQTCVLPGCGRRASHCELDHRVPFPAGGTNADNLQALCKRHHLMKHHSRWRITKLPDGVYQWRTPTGHRYRYQPPELPPPGTRPDQPPDEPPPF